MRIIEVGMHHAEDTKRFFEIFEECTVWGFEPDPRNIERINEWINNEFAQSDHVLNTGLHQLGVFEIAASNRYESDVNFYLSDSDEKWDYSSSLNPPDQHLKRFPWISFDKSIKVKVNTIDNLIPYYKFYFDLLWIDAQGHDLEVIEGAQETLKKTKVLKFEKPIGMYKNESSLNKLNEFLDKKWTIYKEKDGDIIMFNSKVCPPGFPRYLEQKGVY